MTIWLSDFIGNIKATTLGNKITLGAWLAMVWLFPIIFLVTYDVAIWKVLMIVPIPALMVTMITIERAPTLPPPSPAKGRD